MKTRFTDEQIVAFLRQVESGGKSVAEVCRDGGFSQPTFYVWKRRLGSMAEPEVKRLRELEKENGRLKRLLAERDLEVDVARELLQKKGSPPKPLIGVGGVL
jgi:putative transposase